MFKVLVLLSITVFAITGKEYTKRYLPTWDDLSTRPLPEWYDRAKIGIFVHWGVYSVPSFGTMLGEWFWQRYTAGYSDVKDYMEKYYPPKFTYRCFAPMFTAEFFDPDKWATLFADSGARYVVITSKHHDGYALFPSKVTPNWNSMDVGPNRDLIQDLAYAIRLKDLEFGVYYSLYEWYHPLIDQDMSNKNRTSNAYVEQKMKPEVKQLIKDYSPSILWGDGEWTYDAKYWNATDLMAWLYNDSPVRDRVVVNDRWGGGRCRYGDFWNCEDRFLPEKLQSRKWESAISLDLQSWGYRRNMRAGDVMSFQDLLLNVVRAVSSGGNILINIGPTKEGTIPVIFQDRLLKLGRWLEINGEAIYNTSPWYHQTDLYSAINTRYTCVKTQYNALSPSSVPAETDTMVAVYAILLEWPADDVVELRRIGECFENFEFVVEMLGQEGLLNYTQAGTKVEVTLPRQSAVLSKYAWTLKFSKFKHHAERHFMKVAKTNEHLFIGKISQSENEVSTYSSVLKRLL